MSVDSAQRHLVRRSDMSEVGSRSELMSAVGRFTVEEIDPDTITNKIQVSTLIPLYGCERPET
jgi:hypothetical protein